MVFFHLSSFSVHISLHLFLCFLQRCLCFLLYTPHSFCKLFCFFVLPLLSHLKSHPWILPIICFKGQHFSSCVHLIVVSKFCCTQPFWPLLLSMVYEHPEVLFQLLIHPFCLTICLWVECYQQFCLNPQHAIQLLYDARCKLWSSDYAIW